LAKRDMHARDLVEVAGIVASGGPQIVRATGVLAAAQLERYWAASKCRLENWHRALKRAAAEPAGFDRDETLELRATLDEIFVSEMLTRVWTAVLCLRGRRQGTNLEEALARNVLDSHLEVRTRALALLVGGRLGPRQAAALNRVRRRAERWTDVLVGGLVGEGEVGEFAFDAERAADFAAHLAQRRDEAGGRQAWRLTLVSLRNAFQVGLCPLAANAEANGRVTASILGCFPDELYDSTGLFASLWMVRLSAVASDAQGLIDDLLRPEAQASDAASGMSARRRYR
jgi:hypothetical protein